MIPVKLRLRNFMCYRGDVSPLYFDGIHTACICGENGNGKSALIDAMTWALWGKARARSDDELVHSSQSDMEVEFDFRVGQQTYRIIRKHAKPRRARASGQTALELQIAAGDSFKPITGDTQAHTQQKIIDILHMDYDTFVNSAFLRQGRADEFTKQTPAKRKEVLGNILGLSTYAELEERAKSLAREQEIEVGLLESTISDMTLELAQLPASQTEFAAAQSDLSRLDKLVSEHRSVLDNLHQQRESLENKRFQLAQLEKHIQDSEKAIERWHEQIAQHISRIKEYEELLYRRSTIEDGYAQFAEARKLCHTLDQKSRQVAALNEHRHHLEIAINQAGQTLLTEHRLTQDKISELELASQKLPQLKNNLEQKQAQLTQLAAEEETLRQKRRSSQEIQSRIHYIESGQARLQQEMDEIDEKLKMLLSQSGARCPLCDSELGAEGRQLIEAKYGADRLSKSELLKSSQAELTGKKAEFESLEREISRLEVRLSQDKASIQSNLGILNRDIVQAEEARTKLADVRAKLAEIEQRLATRDFASVEQATLSRIEAELAALDYNSEQHDEVRNRLTSLEPFDEAKRKLDEADRLVNGEKETLSRAEEFVTEQSHSLEADHQARRGLTAELERLPGLATQVAEAEAKHQTLAGQQKQAQEKLGNMKAKLERFAQLEVKKREKENRLSQVSREAGIYQELAKAFGKEGIPAQLIEMAIPEIETEANRLLGRMTDNRMHIKMDTQRETKKGDIVETLDINIADELGTRSYETFSGGEAFRINFAIRIALSKLLARRAGAPLPTLIIDEGFGTQDSTGIEKVKEAINSIQDDFDKVLVITHIDDIKDAFPTRIDVIKTPDGSTIELG